MIAPPLLGAWHLACLPGAARFARALDEPEAAQRRLLRRLVRWHAGSAFGRRHGFASMAGAEDFRRQVPLRGWDGFAADVARIRAGEPGVLGCEAVTRLVPTSGTGAARKLVPWTAGLQAGFAAALAPWIADLGRRFPAVRGGPAYWSITPPVQDAEAGTVPVGFADDTAYLGGALARLVAPCLAVPPGVLRSADVLRDTARHLLACRDLRLISVWHPSFLALLLDAIAGLAGAVSPRQLWPRLALVSCWSDGPAALPARALADRLDGVPLQGKGLLATEGVVSIPFAGTHPLAVTSHVVELLGDDGRCRWAWELRPGDEGEVVLSTGGGLWRYRLGDRVRVTGMLGRTPCLRFLGRAGCAHDLAGEKLDEALAADAVAAVGAEYAMLQPASDPPRYRLWLPAGHGDPAGAAGRCERRLLAVHHYAVARRLGQLAAVEPARCALDGGGLLAWLAARRGQRLGAVKPPALLRPDETPPAAR